MGEVIEWSGSIRDLGVTGILALLVLVEGYVIRFLIHRFDRITTKLTDKYDNCQKELLEMAKKDGRN